MKNSQILLKTQKNEIFQILLDKNLEPADFSWTEENSSLTGNLIISKLAYRDGQFYYKFDFSGVAQHSTYSPGSGKAVQKSAPHTWDKQKIFVATWAQLLKKEIDAPDLWQEIDKYRDTFSLAPSTPLVNEPIPTYEVEKIGAALKLLHNQINKQFELNELQNQFVRSKLEYLAEAVKRQGRLDWCHTFIGVFVTIALGLALTPEKAKSLWQLGKSILGQFVRLIGP